jgi:DNA primase large subunit
MRPLHARYPFLGSAREAVDAAAVDLAEVVASDDAVVERALERVEWAMTEGEIGEPRHQARLELLSYPIARVIVSLVDEHVCTRKYARAEAESARQRFTEELASDGAFKSTDSSGLTLAALLEEFEIASAVHETGEGYRIDVATYLELAADQWGDKWRLVNRPLDDGQVPLSSEEVHVLITQAVRHRVEEGLPFDVPDAIAAELDEEVARIREILADMDLMRDIDTVVPELFPPCMQALLDSIQKGEHLEHHSRFAIATFLTGIGMSTDEIVDLFQVNPGFGEEATRYQVDHIRGATSSTEYSTPSCATMQSYGDCINPDDLCDTISHPMGYYERMLDDAEEDELTDWREENSEPAANESD